MSSALTIDVEWERLERGAPEERACFGGVGIRVGTDYLTEASDQFVGRLRVRPYLSAYRLGEWLAWNWWRLRFEPRSNSTEWTAAHHLSGIGGGFVWPNLTIESDGEQIALRAMPSAGTERESLRYVRQGAWNIAASTFEAAVDLFFAQVDAQLRASGLTATNLQKLLEDLASERGSPDMATFRRYEAILGFEPDCDEAVGAAQALLEDSRAIGGLPLDELAAAARQGGVQRVVDLDRAARVQGVEHRSAEVPRLSKASNLRYATDPAWRLGSDVARRLREQESLGTVPLRNERLEVLSAVPTGSLAHEFSSPVDFSYAMEVGSSARLVFRSRWETGRRFELARLLGDHLVTTTSAPLRIMSRAETYRQKAQRAFAAELLCPADGLREFLAGDFSTEAITEASEHFSVSEWAVRAVVLNHRMEDRATFAGDPEWSPLLD